MSQHLSHICFVCSRLDLPGGIERAIVNTANLFADKGHKVSLIITDDSIGSFYPVRNDIVFTSLPLDFGIRDKGDPLTKKIDFVKHLSQLKKQVNHLKPDIIIGTEYSLSIVTYYAAKNLVAKIFAWEHHHFHWLKKSRFWNYLFKKVYPKLHAVVCLNEMEKHLFEGFGCKSVVVPNFVVQQNKAPLNTKIILSIGWLIKRKGVDLIPVIAEKVFASHPDWQWQIIGSGEEEAALRNELKKRGLERNVIIAAPVSADLNEFYQAAALYVMTSRFECFPMVLLEAMSHGVPAVSFDCPTGPSFIIHHGEDGLLLEQENVEAMADALIRLIENVKERNSFGDAAYQNITRFSPGNVYAEWQKLFAG